MNVHFMLVSRLKDTSFIEVRGSVESVVAGSPTLRKKGGVPRTDQTWKGTTRTAGWQTEETKALTAKAGYDCLNNATS